MQRGDKKAKKLGFFCLTKQLVAEMLTGPGYLLLRHPNSRGTCLAVMFALLLLSSSFLLDSLITSQ